MNAAYDVIVIGAGLGGLATAACLARAHKRVLVLEHHRVPGGYAHEFRRGKYRFEVALHALDGASPGGWGYDALCATGVYDRLQLHRLDPFYIYQAPGLHITAPASMIAYESELIRHFPRQATGIRALFDAAWRIYQQTRRMQQDRILDRITEAQIPVLYPDALAAMSQTLAEFVAAYVDDPALLGAFSALWNYFGLPPSQLSAATFVLAWASYHQFGAYYPAGGSMAISRALEAVIKEYQGEIQYGQTVTNIGITNGRATSVETEQGMIATGNAVVANSNAPETLLKLVGPAHLPADTVKQLSGDLTHSLACAVVYLGLDRDWAQTGWPHHGCYTSPTNNPEIDYANVLAGNWQQVPMAITNYSAHDAVAPADGSVISLFTLAPMGYADQWGTGGQTSGYQHNPRYLALKDQVERTLLARAESFLPGLGASIIYKETSTPLTNVRYTLNPSGALYGFAQTVDQTVAGRLSACTPIENLFLAGAWTNPGGGMSAAMLSGVEAAGLTQGYLDKTAARSLFFSGESASAEVEPCAPAVQPGGSTPQPAAPISQPGASASQPASQPAITPVATKPSAITVPAPLFALEVIGGSRQVRLTDFAGRPVVLLFNSAKTADAASDINLRLRNQQPDYRTLPIVTVVNLRGIPRPFRGMARSSMEKSYNEAVTAARKGFASQKIQPPADMTEVVCIAPDWDGKVAAAYDVGDLNQEPVAILVKPDGTIAGRARGAQAESLLKE